MITNKQFNTKTEEIREARISDREQLKQSIKQEIMAEMVQKFKNHLRASMYAELRTEIRQELVEERAATGNTQGAAYMSLSEDTLTGRRLQVFNIIKAQSGLDRHQIHTQLQETYNVEIATSTVSGRITELLSAGLLRVDGIKKS